MVTRYINDMAVEVDGEPEAGVVLMIHGIGGSSNVWGPLMPVYARQQVVRPDLPGSARSSAALPGPLSIERLAEALQEVCAELGLRRVHVVAHAMGALVALHLVTKSPKLVRSLALLAPTQGPVFTLRPMLFKRAQLLRRRELDMQALADQLIPTQLSRRTQSDDPVCSALLREMLMHHTADGYARTVLAWANAEPVQTAGISCPTFLMSGDEDTTCPLDSVARMTDSIPKAQGVVLSNCGHWPMLERPVSSGAALRRFYE